MNTTISYIPSDTEYWKSLLNEIEVKHYKLGFSLNLKEALKEALVHAFQLGINMENEFLARNKATNELET